MKLVFDSIDELIRYVAEETLRQALQMEMKDDVSIRDAVAERLAGICQIVPSVTHNNQTNATFAVPADQPSQFVNCTATVTPEPDRTYGPFRVGDRVAYKSTNGTAYIRGDADDYGTVINTNGSLVEVRWDGMNAHAAYYDTDLILTPDK